MTVVKCSKVHPNAVRGTLHPIIAVRVKTASLKSLSPSARSCVLLAGVSSKSSSSHNGLSLVKYLSFR